MPIRTVLELTLAEARCRIPVLSSLVTWRQDNLPSDKGAALAAPEREWPRELGVDAELLLLVLP
jgi:hypothetical protein